MSKVLTRVQDFVAGYMAENGLDKYEDREERTPLLDAFLSQSLFNAEEVRGGKMSLTNVVKTPVIDRSTVSVVDEFKVTVPSNQITSRFETYTFTGYGFSIEMFPEENEENYISYQNEFNRKMKRGLMEIAKQVELEKCVNLLDTAKNSFWPADVLAQFTGGQIADALQISLAEAENAYDKIVPIFESQDIYDPLIVTASNFHQVLIRQLAGQGEANSINKRYKLGDYTYNFTNRIPTGAGNAATAYAMAQDSVGITHWLPKISQMGLSTRGGGLEYGQTGVMPYIGMPMGYAFKDEEVDTNVTPILGGGSGSTIRQTYQFLTYVTSKAVYNSDPATIFNPILKLEFKNA